jgi:hypothetical protein
MLGLGPVGLSRGRDIDGVISGSGVLVAAAESL